MCRCQMACVSACEAINLISLDLSQSFAIHFIRGTHNGFLSHGEQTSDLDAYLSLQHLTKKETFPIGLTEQQKSANIIVLNHAIPVVVLTKVFN